MRSVELAVVLAAAMGAACLTGDSSAAATAPGAILPGIETDRVGRMAVPQDGRKYQVRAGDTLWSIAGSQLHDPDRWPEIAEASASIRQPGGERLVDPDLIRPGWTLMLPADYGPVRVSGVSGAVAVAAGETHTCAVVSGGHVVCWGSNGWGQLGDGTTMDSTTPVLVPGVSGATAVAAGDYHSCAVITGGEVTCWGDSGTGQLGNGIFKEQPNTPVPVAGVSGATAVAAGDLHSCAVITGGRVTCWGWNGAGQLGNGTSELASATRVLVAGVSGASAAAAGWSHSCAMVVGGQVACWGNREFGQLGDGTNRDQSAAPVLVSGVSGATAVVAGEAHSCAMITGGRVTCWGHNEWGQLGDGTTTNSAAPVLVLGVSGATAVAAGDYHSCAVVSGGKVTCWGRNENAQLGDAGRPQP